MSDPDEPDGLAVAALHSVGLFATYLVGLRLLQLALTWFHVPLVVAN